MLKTSGESWLTAARIRLKRFAGLVTASAHSYRSDLFIRTEIRIVALEVAYAAVLLTLSIGALHFLYSDTLHNVTSALTHILTSSTPTISSDTLTKELQSTRERDIVELSVLIILAAIVFAYLISRVALAPTKNALKAQKRFIGDIAHELRTPLSIIKTNTEVRLLDTDVPQEARRLHEENLEELDRISDTINNLLTLNTLVQVDPVHFSNVDLSKVASHAVNRFGGLARKKDVRIRTQFGRERIAYGNTTGLEQIVENLLKNALQHTQKGGILIIIRSALPSMIELSVSDTGTGISRDDLPHVFQPFYRGDRSRTRGGEGGGGLGLAIVNELVKLHAGRISIKSSRVGTTVTVLLPAAYKTLSSHARAQNSA